MSTVQTIPVNLIASEPSSLAVYAGKVLLLINVASKCGFTPQYEGLEKLYKKYKAQGLEVLGFPSNDFGQQEPGTNAEISSFCRMTFGVQFPMFEKISVMGANKHPLYAALIAAQPVAQGDDGKLRGQLAKFAADNNLPAPNEVPEVLWNFEKFLVARNGEVVARFATSVTPEDPMLVSAVEAELVRK